MKRPEMINLLTVSNSVMSSEQRRTGAADIRTHNKQWWLARRRGGGCKTIGTEGMRWKINNEGRGGDGRGGGLFADSNHYHEAPTEATAAGSLIWAIYTPVRSVQVPTNQAVQNYPLDIVSVHMWPKQHCIVHTHPCTQRNIHCINMLLASTHSGLQTL